MKQIIIAFLLILIFGEARSSGDDGADLLFKQGNRCLVNKQPDKALTFYFQLEKLGVKDAGLYGNMATCYLLSGHKGKALVYGGRSAALSPFNVAILQQNGLPGKVKEEGQGDMFELSLNALIMNRERLIDLLCIFFVISGITYLAYLAFDLKFFKRLHQTFFAVLMVWGFLCLASMSLNVLDRRAIIIADHVKGRSGPSKKAYSSIGFLDAERVTIVSSYRNWLKVRNREGKSAWIERFHVMGITHQP